MKRVATVLLLLAMSLGTAYAAEKSAGDKSQPATTTEKEANAEPGSGLQFEKPKIDLPGGMTGTVGTIESADDPLRPGYLGPSTSSDPKLPAGGLILKKEF
jgi:hypothetical protein